MEADTYYLRGLAQSVDNSSGDVPDDILLNAPNSEYS